MIDDTQVEPILDSLPAHSLIRHMVRYSSYLCDAALAHHLGAAIAVVSAISPPDVMFDYGSPLAGTYWALLVGTSGSRKTAAAGRVLSVLRNFDPRRVSMAHESKASLLESLHAQPQQIAFHGEFGNFLGATKGGKYQESLREQYMELWDAQPVSKARLGDTIEIEKPRFSVLACVAPSLIEQHTTSNAWEGGFFARFGIFYARRTRLYLPPPPGWPEQLAYLMDMLRYRESLLVGPTLGLKPGGHAEAYLRAWSAQRVHEVQSSGTLAEGVVQRLDSLAVRTALVFSLDSGAGLVNGGQPWYIDLESMQRGCAVTDLTIQSTIAVIRDLAGSIYERDRRSVIRALSSSPSTLGAIMARCEPKLPKRRVAELLESLQCEGAVSSVMGVGGAPAWVAGELPVTVDPERPMRAFAG